MTATWYKLKNDDDDIKNGDILMKKFIIVITTLFYSFLGANMIFAADNTWTQKADFGWSPRWGAVGFSIGNKGYIGMGWDVSNQPLKNFWEYDQIANTWTQKADFGGGERAIWCRWLLHREQRLYWDGIRG